MTIVAAVKTRDCLVMGTDSVTQVVGQAPGGLPTVLKAYSNAAKLFHIQRPDAAVATYGIGNIGARSMGGLVADFDANLRNITPTPTTIQGLAQELHRFMATHYNPAYAATEEKDRPVLGFLVGGYSHNQSLSEVWQVRFPDANPVTTVIPQTDFAAAWRGIELPFTRLFFGFDPRIIDGLVQQGILRATAEAALRAFPLNVIFDSMPTQEAIEYTKHILRTTIETTQFEVGVAACGEPLQIAVMQHRKGFTWVEELKYHQ